MTHSTRRQFVATTAAGTAALALAPALSAKAQTAAGKSDSPGWIDAHVHIWTPDIKTYPLAEKFSVDDMQPPSFTAAELLSECQAEGVERVVLVQMVFYHTDHSYVWQAMKEHPGKFSGIALIDVNAPELPARVDALASSGMRGFRLHSLNDADGWVNNDNMDRLWRAAAEKGLAICPLINPSDVGYVETLCKRFPDTTVVVDHFARIGVSGTIESEALEQLCGLARFPNTHVKTSAFYALGKKQAPHADLVPMIRRMLDSYGPQRLMWGSDCPYQVQDGHTYHDSIALIRDRIDFLTTSDKNWLLRDTAAKVFFA